MRLLIVGCSPEGVNVLRRLRLERTVWPLQMCFWDPDLEMARSRLTAVGAGVCLKEITPALLIHVDVVLMFGDQDELQRERKLPLPVIVRVVVDNGTAVLSHVGTPTREQRIVLRVLQNAIDRCGDCNGAKSNMSFETIFAKSHKV